MSIPSSHWQQQQQTTSFPAKGHPSLHSPSWKRIPSWGRWGLQVPHLNPCPTISQEENWLLQWWVPGSQNLCISLTMSTKNAVSWGQLSTIFHKRASIILREILPIVPSGLVLVRSSPWMVTLRHNLHATQTAPNSQCLHFLNVPL